MKSSIFEIMRSIQRFPLRMQHARLSALLKDEPPRSIRRRELEAALSRIVLRDLNAGNRGIRREQVSEDQSQESKNECA